MQHCSAGHLVLGSSLLVIHLFAAEDESLLGGRDPLLLLHPLLDALHLICWFNVDFNLFSSQGLDFDQHSGIEILVTILY